MDEFNFFQIPSSKLYKKHWGTFHKTGYWKCCRVEIQITSLYSTLYLASIAKQAILNMNIQLNQYYIGLINNNCILFCVKQACPWFIFLLNHISKRRKSATCIIKQDFLVDQWSWLFHLITSKIFYTRSNYYICVQKCYLVILSVRNLRCSDLKMLNRSVMMIM